MNYDDKINCPEETLISAERQTIIDKITAHFPECGLPGAVVTSEFIRIANAFGND